jgi:2-hydroxychromene-2-carboxylate isomerase
MDKILDFYFDYSSPFAYLASERIESVAAKHGRRIVWHPILLGAVFKVTGQVPLTQAPLKGDYSMHDFSRSAREHQISYHHPDPFPVASIGACRATLWLRDNPDAAMQAHTTNLVHAIFRAYYTQGRDITKPEVLADIASSLDLDVEKMSTALSEQSIKDALRNEVESAIALGIFGAPTMIVDGEAFWGQDRVDQLDRWLESGGW